MISLKRYKIAQDAERNSHHLKKDINIFERRTASAKKVVLPYYELIEKMININEQSRIADVGSGPTCLARFFKAGRKAYIDPLMNFYKEFYKDKLPDDGSLVNEMAEKTSFPDETFDVVICYNMLDHVFEPLKVVGEMKRILKPNGLVLVGIYMHNPIMKFLRMLCEKSWIFKERPHPYSFSIKDLRTHFKENFIIKVEDMIRGKESILNFKRRFYIFILSKPPENAKLSSSGINGCP